MQTLSANLTAALLTIDARLDPRRPLDLYELYDPDYIPGVNGFDPNDAAETFAGVEITHNGVAYRREVVTRGDITRSMTEKTNSVNVEFSNISRYLATLAQSQTIEGMFLVIRCVVPSVTDDDIVLFVGRCEKPSDIDKQSFNLSARQDFGNINQTLPPRKFTAQDPLGRPPSDPEFEGINFIAQSNLLYYNVVVPERGIGALFGRRDDELRTAQSSSMDGTPYGSVVPEVLGRCQMLLIPFLWKDQGAQVAFLMAACNGPIDAMEHLKVRTEGWSELFNSFEVPPDPPVVHLGLVGTANVLPTNFPQAGYFSRLAYLDANSSGSTVEQIDTPPEVTAIIRGRIIPLPDGSGDYVEEGWSDNPVHILRFLLTDPSFVNINPAFMEDAAFVREAQYCNKPLIDDSQDQVIRVLSDNAGQVGQSILRFRSTGLYTPQYFNYYELGTDLNPPELRDVDDPDDFIEWDYDNPFTTIYQNVLRKRYTCNVPITGEVRAVDFIYKTLNPTAKIFLRVNKYGRYEPVCEKPSDATYLRSATAVGDTSILIQDVTPWKTGPNLLTGRLLLGFNTLTSEVRNVTGATYTADGNAITLTVSKTGGVTITASGGTLSGGSTTVQASGTITIGGTPAPGNTVTATINGHSVTYTLDSEDDVNTAAAMLGHYINATPRLQKYILATWDAGTPTVITLTCLYGVLTLDSHLLQTHTGPVADPMIAPTIAGSGSGILLAGVYKVAYANVGPLGETAITPISSVTLTVNQKIDVSGLPAFPAGITSRNFYMSDQAGSSHLRFIVNRVNASDFSINSLPLPNASIPPSHNRTSDELIRIAMSFSTNSQDVLPAWEPGRLVLLNDIYLPATPNGHKYQVTTQGTTAATEPAWPTTSGGVVSSGSAVFTEVGPTYLGQAGLTRSNVKKDSFKWPLGSRQASINQVKIKYRSAKDDFALVPYHVNDPIHQEQVKKVYPLEVDGSAIDNFHQMYRIANWTLAKNREGDWFNSLGTGPQGLVLEEGDLICASDDSGGLVNVVTRIEELRIHANHDVSINQGRKYSTNMFSDDVRAEPIPLVSTLRFAGLADSVVQFLDTAPIRDEDAVTPGFYVVVSRVLVPTGEWRGWTLWVDFGDGYTQIAEGDIAATIGGATTTLAGVADTSVFDTVNTITFTVQYGNKPYGFTNATQDELDANPYRNLFLIGNEYVQAGTITDNGSESFTLSNLYRGRISSWGKTTHRSGERVIHMNGAEVFVPMSSLRRGIPYLYKPVTVNQDVDDATPVSFTWSGGTYRPSAPQNITFYNDAYSLGSGAIGQAQFSIPFRKNIYNEIPRYAIDAYLADPDGTFTVDATTNVFTATSHGLTVDDTIAFSTTGVLPFPIQQDEHYFLRDVTTHTFKLARTATGAAIDITDTGSGTHSYSRRLRHMPVIQGTVNPVVVDKSSTTEAGSGGWLETISSIYYLGNRLNTTATTESLRTFGEITQSGFFAEFTLSTIAKEVTSQIFAMSFANPANAAAITNAYYQMRFELIVALPPKYGATSRRWQLEIYESVSGVISGPAVYTSPDYEVPDTRYRIQISGSEVRFFRNYSGPGSEHIFRSTIPAVYPMVLDASVTNKASFLDVTTGGRPEYITTYPADDMIADTGIDPPPAMRYRVYEQRTFQGVTYDGDATDFIPFTPTLVNFALASNGSTATASSEYTAGGYNMVASKAINGDRTGAPTSPGVPTTLNVWHSAGGTPDHWLEVAFGTTRVIEMIDVIGVQDNLVNPGEPTLSTTGTLYHNTAFDVEYWNGSSWVVVTGGTVTGNTNIWKQFLFTPVSTTKIRVLIHSSVDGFGRLAEVQAWGY